ncbi:MAG: hypothetical protein ABIO94_08615, partial [Opitutaceae bacterium]
MKTHLLLLLSLLVVGASAAETRAPAAPTPVAPTTTPATGSTRRNAAMPPGRGNATRRNPASSVASSSDGDDNFSVITDRNIFNAYRTGIRRPDNSAPAPHLDLITLYGVMDSEKGLRAFFDGSDAAYRKALHVGDSV